jgi:hypothetical protein
MQIITAFCQITVSSPLAAPMPKSTAPAVTPKSHPQPPRRFRLPASPFPLPAACFTLPLRFSLPLSKSYSSLFCQVIFLKKSRNFKLYISDE